MDMQEGKRSKSCNLFHLLSISPIFLYDLIQRHCLWFIASCLIIPDLVIGQGTFDRWSMITLVRLHQETKKDMRVQDVCKLLCQNSFGVEHLLSDTSAVREYLHEELLPMDTIAYHESLIERISLMVNW